MLDVKGEASLSFLGDSFTVDFLVLQLLGSISPSSVLECSLSLQGKNCVAGLFSGTEQGMITCSPHFDQLQFAAMVSVTEMGFFDETRELQLSVGIRINT